MVTKMPMIAEIKALPDAGSMYAKAGCVIKNNPMDNIDKLEYFMNKLS
jgi:hypothetical protein